MGALEFTNYIFVPAGEKLKDRFDELVTAARYMHGHGGYTGTVAEKSNYRLVERPKGKPIESFISDEKMTAEKCGPAKVVSLKGTKLAKELRDGETKGKRGTWYCVFGIASW